MKEEKRKEREKKKKSLNNFSIHGTSLEIEFTLYNNSPPRDFPICSRFSNGPALVVKACTPYPNMETYIYIHIQNYLGRNREERVKSAEIHS